MGNGFLKFFSCACRACAVRACRGTVPRSCVRACARAWEWVCVCVCVCVCVRVCVCVWGVGGGSGAVNCLFLKFIEAICEFPAIRFGSMPSLSVYV